MTEQEIEDLKKRLAEEFVEFQKRILIIIRDAQKFSEVKAVRHHFDDMNPPFLKEHPFNSNNRKKSDFDASTGVTLINLDDLIKDVEALRNGGE